jgi:hypothetical protein
MPGRLRARTRRDGGLAGDAVPAIGSGRAWTAEPAVLARLAGRAVSAEQHPVPLEYSIERSLPRD